MEIINYFSTNIQNQIIKHLTSNVFENLEEIRLRTNQDIIIKFTNKEEIINYSVTTEDILKTLEKITENSIYTYQNQICNGFITVKGGHRVGITGNVAIEDEKVVNIVYVYSLNFRIARQVKNCSNFLLDHIYKDNKTIYNTIILGAPGSGKTTVLRDLIRNLSNGNKMINGMNVGLIDERSEISAMYKGIPQTDLGPRTDILENIPKVLGIKMMVRSMAPKIIAVDEIGGSNEADGINYAICSGVKWLFTAHGESLMDLIKNPELNNIISKKIIEKILVLSSDIRGCLEKKYYLDKSTCKYIEY